MALLIVRSAAITLFWAMACQGAQVRITTLQGQTIEFYRDTYALVVGVEQYEHWPERPDAVKNARDVSWDLRRLGFSVRLLINPGIDELWAALEEFAQVYGQQVNRGLVFYFCGNSHSLTGQDGGKKGWILPADAPAAESGRQALEKKAISIAEVATLSGQIRSRHALFLFDAPIAAKALQTETAVLKIVSSKSALPTRQCIAAGAAEQPAFDQEPFCKYLLKALQGQADLIHDGVVSGSELGVYLSNRVAQESNEQLRLQFGRIGSSIEDGGDFVFKLTQSKLETARLFVDSQPPTATVRIMNIKPRFEQGIELDPGSYRVQVSAEGYATSDQWVQLAAGEDRVMKIRLDEEQDEITNSFRMRFMRILPGRFSMGSPANEPGRSNDENRHRVRLTRRFYIQSTELTYGQFDRFVQATGYKTDAEKTGGCWTTVEGAGWKKRAGTSWKKPGTIKMGAAMPVVCVTWNDAAAFARWLSRQEAGTYRLPTEAEWEYAARAGTQTPFSTGRCLSTAEANYASTGYPYQRCTTVFLQKRGLPINTGTLAPNPWKLHNIHGNVSEWCLDWYGPYPDGSTTNPNGPKSGSERVMRGGHWQADAAGCRSAKRWRLPPNFASDVVGFRLVLLP